MKVLSTPPLALQPSSVRPPGSGDPGAAPGSDQKGAGVFGPAATISLSSNRPNTQIGNDAEKRQTAELQRRDREVRIHEQAHKSVGGGHAGAIHLDLQRGPDGINYAVGGSVPIDVSPVKGDPRATMEKMAVVQRAALAPADPSGADRQIAARAAQLMSEARLELATQSAEAANGAKTSDEAGRPR